ncbi:MAG TPA: hypothetical protein VN805_09740 [Caulobacteraceae bacterium]|nr:hypothetical protein [Caulobacteraceae bacterium]
MPTRAKAGSGGAKPDVRHRPERAGAPQRHRRDGRAARPTGGGEPDIERSLDEALKGTFPASDPVALPLRAD